MFVYLTAVVSVTFTWKFARGVAALNVILRTYCHAVPGPVTPALADWVRMRAISTKKKVWPPWVFIFEWLFLEMR